MASTSKSETLRAAPSPLIFVTLVVLVLLFVGWMAYSHLFAGPQAAPMTVQAKASNDRLKQLAKQSGGDIGKLSEDDRNWVTQNTGGYGAMVLQNLAKENK